VLRAAGRPRRTCTARGPRGARTGPGKAPACPAAEGLGDDVSVTAGAAATTCVTTLEVLPAYVTSPPYRAINKVEPVASVVIENCAWPPARFTVPTTVPLA